MATPYRYPVVLFVLAVAFVPLAHVGAQDKAAESHKRLASPAKTEGREEAEALVRQAVQHDNRGEYDKAADCARRALKLLEPVLGPDHADVEAVLEMLGIVSIRLGEY